MASLHSASLTLGCTAGSSRALMTSRLALTRVATPEDSRRLLDGILFVPHNVSSSLSMLTDYDLRRSQVSERPTSSNCCWYCHHNC
jgi:hypothetical protein